MMKTVHLLIASGLVIASSAFAQMPMPMPGNQMPTQGQAMRGQAEGEVTRITKETNRISLRHSPIPAMEMNGMNMVFQVKDASVLDRVKVGDKVRFTAVRENGAMFAERIELIGGTAGTPAEPAKKLEAPSDPHAAH